MAVGTLRSASLAASCQPLAFRPHFYSVKTSASVARGVCGLICCNRLSIDVINNAFNPKEY